MSAPDKKNVFVVHGRNKAARDAMFAFLRAIGLTPIEWGRAMKETGSASPYIGEVIDAGFKMAQATVVLMTPDEMAYLLPEYAFKPDERDTKPAAQARPNVLFEAGMAMGLQPDRTILVELGELRSFSDVAGVHTLRLNNTQEKRNELVERLETAGCAVDRSGADWLKKGRFSVPKRPKTTAQPSEL